MTVTELAARSGLGSKQLGVLFGVSGTAVRHWERGGQMTQTQVARLNELSTRVRTRSGSPADVRAWLLTADQTGQSPYAQWVRERSTRTPADGRSVAEQLTKVAVGTHVAGTLDTVEPVKLELRKL